MTEEETLPEAGIITQCIACICCLLTCALCTPCLILCCCCSGANTAVNKAQGKRWDAVQHKWVLDNLQQDEATLQTVPGNDDDVLKATHTHQDDSKPSSAAAVPSVIKETTYYDALGVPPDADESKIKKAYYMEARKWHPDRNDSDEAKAKFQQIGEAYQVLSNPKLRAIYDKEGQDGLSGDRTEAALGQVDPSLVFTFLFGSDAFQDIVGRLHLVTQVMLEGQKTSPKDMMELERRRIIRLAIKLRQRVQSYVDGNVDAAKAEWKSQGEHLVEVHYGEEILNTVGSTYKLVATQCIGSWGEGIDAQMSEHRMKRGAAVKAFEGAQTMQQGGEMGQDQLPTYIETMWNVTVIDISSTLHEVVMKLCNDKSVEESVRKKRAEAIRDLGEIWEETKSKKLERDRRSVRGLYQSAAQAAMEETLKKMQQEEGKADGS